MDIKVLTEQKGVRLDNFLCQQFTQHSRNHIQNLIKKGNILVNGAVQKSGYILRENDEIKVDFPEPVSTEIKGVNIPLDILYQDQDLAVINKQQGMTVHPAPGHSEDTLVNALLYSIKDLSGINGELRPGIVHRLDKDTSGVMLVAKNDFSHRNLAQQIADKSCEREYIALVEGHLPLDEGEIITHIARDSVNRKKMRVSQDGQDRIAITNYWKIKEYPDYTLAGFKLQTGRTHQIRVHCQYIKHPVVGDKLYGYKKQEFNLKGQLLHSAKITFTHPRSQKRMSFQAPMPEHFDRIVNILNGKLR